MWSVHPLREFLPSAFPDEYQKNLLQGIPPLPNMAGKGGQGEVYL